MVVCRFWQQGTCRYGTACKFEHPGANTNRFGVFGTNGAATSNSAPASKPEENPFHISKDVIQRDLTLERPGWILSSYGPSKDAPEQLFGGYPMEQSFEELRLHHMKGVASGNVQVATNEIDALYREAQSRIQNAVNNLDGAVQFVVQAAARHPNRIDVCKNNSLPGGTTGEFSVEKQQRQQQQQSTNAFGGGGTAAAAKPANAFAAPTTTTTTAGGFGQPSALGQTSSPFGAPAFGQPSKPTSAFGQPSQLGGGGGSTGGSAFGQPSQLGGGVSGFGQPSAMGPKPSPFGAPAFGQPAQAPGTATAFGQPSQLGASGGSAFGQPSQLGGGGGTGFGQPSTLGPKPSPFSGGSGMSPFASMGGGGAGATATASPFGQPSQSNPSPFGAPSAAATTAAPATTMAQTGIFGKPSTATATTSPFGQPQAPFGKPATTATTSPFGTVGASTAATSPFGQPAASSSSAANPFQQAAAAAATTTTRPAFGQPSNPSSGFGGGFGSAAGAPSQQQPAAPTNNTTTAGAATTTGPYAPNATRQHPPIESYATRDPATGALRTFKQKPVTYQTSKDGKTTFPALRSFDGSFVRVWFPDGPPPYYRDTELEEGAYDDKSRAQWEVFVRTGRFEGGVMPELPPKREWCRWDF